MRLKGNLFLKIIANHLIWNKLLPPHVNLTQSMWCIRFFLYIFNHLSTYGTLPFELYGVEWSCGNSNELFFIWCYLSLTAGSHWIFVSNKLLVAQWWIFRKKSIGTHRERFQVAIMGWDRDRALTRQQTLSETSINLKISPPSGGVETFYVFI